VHLAENFASGKPVSSLSFLFDFVSLVKIQRPGNTICSFQKRKKSLPSALLGSPDNKNINSMLVEMHFTDGVSAGAKQHTLVPYI
jgi:hypothetical protein